jgi:phage-related protein
MSATGGFKIAEAYVDITARNLMADALASAVKQIRGVGTEADAVGAKSSATGLLGSKAFLAIGAAAAGGAVEVVKMAGDFQSSTNRLITSAGESRANIGLVRDGILAMAGAVGYSAEELSTAMYKIQSGGQHGADGLKVLQAAAEGAKAENADLTVVADAVTSALQDYHLQASASADVTSKLVAATSAGKMTFQELAGSMSAILPIASANHISLNDILGDLASMTVHGISAQQASQDLANAVQALAAPNAQAAKEMAALGLNATDVSLKLGQRGLSGTVQLIAQAIQKDMGPDSTAVVINLQNALKGLPPAVQDLGMKVMAGTLTMGQFHKALSGMDPITASQAQSFETLAASTHKIGTESLSGSQIIQSYTQALGKAMGGATGLNVALMLTGENTATTTTAIKAVTDATAQADGHTRGWTDIQGTFNQRVAEAKDGLGAFAIEIGTIALPVLTKVAGALADGALWLSKHKDAAIIAASIVGGVLVVAFVALGVAIWTAIAPFVPLGLAISAVIAVGVLLVAHWGDVKRAAGDVFGYIRDFVTGVWNKVSSVTTTVWDAITRYFQRLFAAHRELVMSVYGPLRDYIITAWNTVHDVSVSVWNAISSFFSGSWNAIRSTATSVWNAIVNFLTPGMNAFRGSFGGVWNGIVGDFQNIWGRVTGIAQVIWNNVVGAFRWGVNQVLGVINGLVDGTDTVLRFLLIPLIPHIPLLAAGGVMGLAGGGTVGAGFTTNGPMAIVGEGNPNHPEYVIPTDPAHRGNALSLYQSLGAKLMAGGGIIDWIGSTVSKVEKWTGDGALGLMNQAVSGLAGGIPEPYRDVASGVGHKVVAAVKAMIDHAQAAAASFSAAFTGSPNLSAWIQQALGLTGTPGTWAGPLSVLIGRESGGNPNAINRWDSNAAAGHPSQGLMQTIPGTFNAYHQAGTSWNILDPVANIAAGINYIKARYGSIFNVQQANPNLPPKGYDAGGLLPTGLSLVRNSTGAPERVLNATQTAKLDRLLAGRGGAGSVTVNVTQVAGSPAETGRFVALALRTVG